MASIPEGVLETELDPEALLKRGDIGKSIFLNLFYRI